MLKVPIFEHFVLLFFACFLVMLNVWSMLLTFLKDIPYKSVMFTSVEQLLLLLLLFSSSSFAVHSMYSLDKVEILFFLFFFSHFSKIKWWKWNIHWVKSRFIFIIKIYNLNIPYESCNNIHAGAKNRDLPRLTIHVICNVCIQKVTQKKTTVLFFFVYFNVLFLSIQHDLIVLIVLKGNKC